MTLQTCRLGDKGNSRRETAEVRPQCCNAQPQLSFNLYIVNKWPQGAKGAVLLFFIFIPRVHWTVHREGFTCFGCPDWLKESVKARTTSVWDHCGRLEARLIRVAKRMWAHMIRMISRLKFDLAVFNIPWPSRWGCSSSCTSSKFICWVWFEKSLRSYLHVTVNTYNVYNCNM